jgi:sigma-B regulation protein RsbU (phosphoserine phosphatase)
MKPTRQIRWKLMILLLTISLIPLAASSFLQRQWMRRNGQILAERQREDLDQDAREILQYLINDYTRSLQRAHDVINSIVLTQAHEVQTALDAPAPEMPATVYFDTDFDAGRRPPGAVLSEEYALLAGKATPEYISWEHQALMTFPGVDRQAVADDLARLASLDGMYQRLRLAWPDIVQWQYTTLASGIQSYLPGHGNNSDYDARTREWYQETVEANAITLYAETDAMTGSYILTASVPLHNAAGDVIGVTSVDVPLEHLANELRLLPDWINSGDNQRDATVLFAYIGTDADIAEANGTPLPEQVSPPKVITFAEVDYRRSDRRVRYTEHTPLLPEHAPGNQQLLDDIAAGRGNVIHIEHHGQPALLAYGAIDAEKFFPLIIVPIDVFDGLADKADEFVRKQFTRGLVVTGAMLLIATVIVIVTAFWSSRSISQPISTLVEATTTLRDGNFDTRVEIHTRDEIQELGDAFNAMVPQLQHRQQMAESLAVAREVQQNLLPHELPTVEGFDVHGGTRYCDETGGDYYDFIPLDDHRLVVALGDVSGHGIGPALLMASARSIIRARAEEYAEDLQDLFDRLNVRLVRDTGDARFMTLFYGLLDSSEGKRRLMSISGGHDPAIWLRADGTVIELKTSGGLPLGIFEDAAYEPSAPVDLATGEVVVVGTDGIWEATNADGEMFGKERLTDLLSASAGQDAETIYQTILQAVLDFIGQSPRTDDITLLVIRAL